MKKNWEIKKLGDVCDLLNGFAFRSKDYVELSNTMNFRMSQIRPGGGIDLDNNPKYLPDIFREKYKDYLLNDGDIVIAMTDMATETKILGVPTIVKTDTRKLLLNQRVGKLCKIDQTKIFIPFLRYMLTSPQINGYYKSLGRGGLQINIGKQDILNVRIPFPSFIEQKWIVKVLDKIFEKIAKAKENAEKNLQNACELFESYLQNIFANTGDEWEEKSLEELGNITSSKRIFKSEYVNEGIPFYRIKEIKELANSKSISLELFISRKRYNEIKTKYGIPKEGDILLSAVGTIGEIYVVQRNDEFYFKDGNILWLKNFNLVNTYYLKYALKSFVEQIKTLSRGAAYRALTIEKLSKYKVPIMSMKEQQAIVAKLDTLSAETRKLEVIYQQKLDDLEGLKKSILQKAFKGEHIGGRS